MRYLSEDGSLKLDLKSKAAKKGYIHWFSQTKKNLKKNLKIKLLMVLKNNLKIDQ